jgi:hypothetical protein
MGLARAFPFGHETNRWRGENAFYSKPWIADSLEAARNSELGPAGRARRLSRKIKAELRALASGGKRDGIIAHIDSIGGIKGESRRATRVPRNEGTVMKIVGWAVPRGSDEPFDAVVVRLIGEDGVVAAPAVLVQRPDVKSLAFGSYKLDIIGVDAGGRMHGVLARELIIE